MFAYCFQWLDQMPWQLTVGKLGGWDFFWVTAVYCRQYSSSRRQQRRLPSLGGKSMSCQGARPQTGLTEHSFPRPGELHCQTSGTPSQVTLHLPTSQSHFQHKRCMGHSTKEWLLKNITTTKNVWQNLYFEMVVDQRVIQQVIESMASCIGILGLKSQLCYLLAMWPQVRFLSSVGLTFLFFQI